MGQIHHFHPFPPKAQFNSERELLLKTAQLMVLCLLLSRAWALPPGDWSRIDIPSTKTWMGNPSMQVFNGEVNEQNLLGDFQWPCSITGEQLFSIWHWGHPMDDTWLLGQSRRIKNPLRPSALRQMRLSGWCLFVGEIPHIFRVKARLRCRREQVFFLIWISESWFSLWYIYI